VRASILQEAKKRFKRAGIYNAQFHEGEEKLKHLEGQVDWLVLDVPCSGTGTLRRNPDVKLKFNTERLEYYVKIEKRIILKMNRLTCKEVFLIML